MDNVYSLASARHRIDRAKREKREGDLEQKFQTALKAVPIRDKVMVLALTDEYGKEDVIKAIERQYLHKKL